MFLIPKKGSRLNERLACVKQTIEAYINDYIDRIMQLDEPLRG